MASVRYWLSRACRKPLHRLLEKYDLDLHLSKRLYARGSLPGDDSVIDRIPARVRRRLAKEGVSVEEYLQNAMPESNQGVHFRSDSANMPPPSTAPAGFQETLHGLEVQLENMSGNSSASPSPEDFPSDIKKYKEWHRDQSKKAIRPSVDPTNTSIILFPGQGSQFVGMGKDTLGYGQASELFEEASATLKYDLLKMCLSGPLSALNKTEHCQLAVLVSSLAAAEKLQTQNAEAVESCVGTAGFSVGEYAALVFAGVMSFADAVRVVQVRAEAMQRASEEVSSGMMTTFLGRDCKLNLLMKTAREYCQQRCGISEPVCRVANYLYPECKVIAGHTEALEFVEEHGRTFGVRRTKRLPVSGAFHTSLMSSAQEPLSEALKQAKLGAPLIPVYSNVTASSFGPPRNITRLLVKQVTQPVKWEQMMHAMYSRPTGHNFPATYESGPGNQLGSVLRLVNAKAHAKYTHVDV